MNYVYLAIAILSEVVATSSLKASKGFTVLGPSLLTIAGYCVAFFFLSLTMATIPTGIAYAIWSGVGVVLISAVGWVWFKQNLDAPALIGIGLIVLGVVVINLFSKTSAH